VALFSVSHMPQEVRAKVANLKLIIDKNSIKIEGKTASYYIKQMAQEAVRRFLPEIKIENCIAVEY